MKPQIILGVTKRSYSDPAFVAEAHAWAHENCSRLGIAIIAPIEQPHIRPWSTVFRVPTDSGAVFLKCCGGNQAHEPRLTALLEETRPLFVPHVLALHPALPWMLLADGGAKLRDVADGPAFDAWVDVLPRYADLQRAVAPRAAELLAIGTPDHRLASLASRFEALLRDERVMRAAGEALGPAELKQLFALLPRITDEARELDALGIPPSIQHDDLHDANILVRDGRRVVFDWGDACVSHPFFSMLVVSRLIAYQGGFADDSPELVRVRDAYLEPWGAVAPRSKLAAAFAFVRRLGSVDHVLTWHRVASFADDDALGGIADREAFWLREILTAFM